MTTLLIGRTGRAGKSGRATAIYVLGDEPALGNGDIAHLVAASLIENGAEVPAWLPGGGGSSRGGGGGGGGQVGRGGFVGRAARGGGGGGGGDRGGARARERSDDFQTGQSGQTFNVRAASRGRGGSVGSGSRAQSQSQSRASSRSSSSASSAAVSRPPLAQREDGVGAFTGSFNEALSDDDKRNTRAERRRAAFGMKD